MNLNLIHFIHGIGGQFSLMCKANIFKFGASRRTRFGYIGFNVPNVSDEERTFH